MKFKIWGIHLNINHDLVRSCSHLGKPIKTNKCLMNKSHKPNLPIQIYPNILSSPVHPVNILLRARAVLPPALMVFFCLLYDLKKRLMGSTFFYPICFCSCCFCFHAGTHFHKTFVWRNMKTEQVLLKERNLVDMSRRTHNWACWLQLV